VQPDGTRDTLETARAVLARLRCSPSSECVVSAESVESPPYPTLTTLSTLTTQPVDAPNAGTPTEPRAQPTVNRGMLMTVGHYHGYPPLRLKPGVAIAEGYRAWRTFSRDSAEIWLALAVDAARAAWPDDPMILDLIFVEGDEDVDHSLCRNDNCICQNRRHDHFDFDEFFDDWRATQEDKYFEHGAGSGAS
jgi:hypothetical protein